ncbi:MAG: hypothetical protein ACTSRH_02450 [Promethearchaeota archaeon]
MFYKDDFTPNALRLGDVIEGYVNFLPIIDSPWIEPINKEFNFRIEFIFSKFYVIMTPCCNIEHQLISLSPLRKIPNNLFKNPYLVEDFTRINREMDPQYTVPPDVWTERFSQEERQRRLSQGKGYVFNYYFVYKENDIFSEYEVNIKGKKIKTRYYLVDFRYNYPLKCEKITRQKIDDIILRSKCLELTVFTREELRNKLAFYYGRPAPEDNSILSS